MLFTQVIELCHLGPPQWRSTGICEPFSITALANTYKLLLHETQFLHWINVHFKNLPRFLGKQACNVHFSTNSPSKNGFLRFSVLYATQFLDFLVVTLEDNVEQHPSCFETTLYFRLNALNTESVSPRIRHTVFPHPVKNAAYTVYSSQLSDAHFTRITVHIFYKEECIYTTA